MKKISSVDPRIKILNNKNNRGTLFSRNIGMLNSKGQCIMNLDNDDLFLNQDVFDILYKEIDNSNFDIIGFSGVECYTYTPKIYQMHGNYFFNHKNGLNLIII